MAGVELPHAAVREQVSAAVDLVVQLARRADGHRFVRLMAGQDRAGSALRPLDPASVERLVEARCGG